jgi:predicted GNAT family N-acyltransferase
MFNIQVIDPKHALYNQVIDLRHYVLRVPIGLSIYEEDLSGDLEDFTFIIVNNDEVLGCLMGKPISKTEIKLRQMAIKPQYQSKGLGSKLMIFAQQYIKGKGYHKISLHARKNVTPFYEQLGYTNEGAEFYEVGIPHIKMVQSI